MKKTLDKKGVEISLQFLLGLVFTGFLIVFSYAIVSKFFFIAPIEKDFIENWVSEIEQIKADLARNSDSNSRTTQLLPGRGIIDINNAVILIFPKSSGFEDRETSLTLRRQEEKIRLTRDPSSIPATPLEGGGEISTRPTTEIVYDDFLFNVRCGNDACICSYNFKSKNGFCQTVESTRFTVRVDGVNANTPLLYYMSQTYTLVNKDGAAFPVTNTTPFVKVDVSTRAFGRGSSEITICLNRDEC